MDIFNTEINGFTLRKAKSNEMGLVLELIKELAVYEKMLDEVMATEELLYENYVEKQRIKILIAEYENSVVGYMLYFYNFSTFVGKSGIYLEDLYIKPEYRGKGFGKVMLKQLTKFGLEQNCGRVEWTCLDWNQKSIDFYLHIGAVPMNEWTVYRLTHDAMKKFAE